ncbi:MAG: MiaB/RimO family radical SAM methylthiotransferase [Gemmatimonadetes bacterium]|nr:MiaB/RimO family radical SAM methylthiotransferase [Gemmatimonadota bacterium]
MNLSDTELMHGILAARGYRAAESIESADVILVNTCAIRDHAEQRVLGRVGELNRLKLERPGLVIGVTGCMAQRMGAALLERAPYVELVMGPDGYRGLPDVLARLRPETLGLATAGSPIAAQGGRGTIATIARRELPVMSGAHDPFAIHESAPRVPMTVPAVNGRNEARRDFRAAVLDLDGEENYEGIAVHRTSRVSAWVPIQRGCDHRCTFCIVPYVRGGEKNREPTRILDEVRAIARDGIPEVVLLGQTVNSYRHGLTDFARLLRQVARVDGIRRVRFTSPHPNDVTPELVEVMATEPAVCKQLHLPVQAGHDRTLKRMLRRYTVAAYLDKVRRVRDAIPDIALSTDVIVAFPGETEDEYQATLALLREVRFDDAFLYKYSVRDGTPASRLPADQFVAPDIAQARLEHIIEVQRGITAEINASQVGRVVELLVERRARSEGDMLGRTGSNKVAAFPGDERFIGCTVLARLTATTGATFRAVPVSGAIRVA